MVDHISYYFAWKGVVNDHPEVFVYIPRVIVIFLNFSILGVNVIKNARDNVGINMKHLQVVNMSDYSALFIINIVFHNTPIIFVSLVLNIF